MIFFQIIQAPEKFCLHSVAVSTPPFHGGSMSSILIGDAIFANAKAPNNKME